MNQGDYFILDTRKILSMFPCHKLDEGNQTAPFKPALLRCGETSPPLLYHQDWNYVTCPVCLAERREREKVTS
jgi:hypothetical protein